MSSFTIFSRDHDRVLEVVTVPRHERDEHVAAEREFAVLGVQGPSAMTWPFFTCSPFFTIGFWLTQVAAFERMNLRSS